MRATAQPPGRVRHTFKKWDTDANGGLTLEELQKGFESTFGAELTAHAKASIPILFDANAAGEPKELKIGQFSRFFAEILFKQFDANNNKMLEVAEATAALKFLKKTSAEGGDTLNIALPADAEKGLPFGWFLSMYQSIELRTAVGGLAMGVLAVYGIGLAESVACLSG